MVDLLRPEPRSSPGQRLGRVLGAVSVARLATGAGAVLLVAVTAWWLLRSPAPPVERSLPSARATAVHASTQGSTAAGRPGSASTGAPVASGPPASADGLPVGAGGSSSGAAATTAPDLVVQAAGAVTRPGVYRLPERRRGSRRRHGGRRPECRCRSPGRRPRCPGHGRGADLRAPTGRVTTAGARYRWSGWRAADCDRADTAAPLDLNEATENELDTLPGVGPATAKAIVDYRTEHGPFASVDDLLDVRGIGPAKLDGFRALVRVG